MFSLHPKPQEISTPWKEAWSIKLDFKIVVFLTDVYL